MSKNKRPPYGDGRSLPKCQIQKNSPHAVSAKSLAFPFELRRGRVKLTASKALLPCTQGCRRGIREPAESA